MRPHTPAFWCLPLLGAGVLCAGALAAQPPRRPQLQPQPAPPLRFEYAGPDNGGRLSAVAGVAGDTLTYYVGAGSGGVWKSTDGARTWEPIFDGQPVQAIGALAVAPSNPHIVWAGTGEAWAIRDADVMGDGVYRSADGGATWTHAGLTETGRIGRIVVHPTNPEVVYVCALGRATGPQPERGVFRTMDGGRHWERVLFVDANTGCSGLAMDPANPDVLFAGTWDVVMHTWAMFSGGPGSGVYVSRDGGTTWKRIQGAGLPTSPVGKIDVAFAPSNTQRVFALIQTANQGSLWRSDDGGGSWQVVSWDRTLIGRAGYYIRVAVNPGDPDDVVVANSSLHRSTDGGRTFTVLRGGCGDCHDIWWDAAMPDHWAVTGDGGAGITRDGGQRFTTFSLPIGQMYHVAVDTRVPYWLYSNRQDDGTMRGPNTAPALPSNVPSYLPDSGRGRGGRFGGGFGRGGGDGGWQGGIGGCESGFTIPDPTDADIVWATCYANTVTRYDHRLGRARSVAPWLHTLDSPPTDTRYRCHWTPPLAIDPFDHNTVYYGCQVVFRTTDGGQHWDVISPDLSTQDSSRIAFSGGIIGDNLGQFYGEVVFAIAPSPLQQGLIWAGTNDGKLWLTRDGGDHWSDLTANVSGMPVWGTIRQVAPSPFDSAAAYVAVDYHMMDNRDPYIFKTTDYGRTWKKVTGNLPTGHPLAYVMTMAENPNRRGMLFAGTGNGFFYSMDDGSHWTRLQDGLPGAPVTWVVVEPRFHDVVVSTYGRGLYVLRDITRLEQADDVAPGAVAHLYVPRDGYREARSGSVPFLYRLAAAPEDTVRIEILDAQGTVIRRMAALGRAGLNRAAWDLRYEGPAQPARRTLPPDNPHIWDEPRFRGQDTRPIVHWGIQSPQRVGPIAAPGSYTVRLVVDGETVSRPFRVLKDPAIPSPDADLVASTAAQIRVRDDLNRTVDLINRLEVMRKQIEDLEAAHRDDGETARALATLDGKLLDVELRLLSRTELHSDDKWYVEAYKVYLNLVWLSGDIGTGASDLAGGAEYRPTDASLEALAMLEDELVAAERAFHQVMADDVAAFNRAMTGALPPIADPMAGTREEP